MWQINLRNSNKQITIYFANDPFADSPTPASEQEKQSFLRKIAAAFFERHYFSSRTLSSDAEHQHVYVLHTRQVDTKQGILRAHFATRTEPEKVMPALIEEINLDKNSKITYDSTVEVLPTLEEFNVIFDITTRLKWPEPPMNVFDVELVGINLASQISPNSAIDNLCRYLDLSTDERKIVVHLKQDFMLKAELLPLVDEAQHIDHYKQLISTKVAHPGEASDDMLRAFVAKEKAKLLLSMKAAKTKKIERLVANKMQNLPGHYNSVTCDAMPSRYLNLENTISYIKKNILIALYNAARDYYKECWAEYSKYPADMNVNIKKFNEKFIGIASIDPTTLNLTPISLTFANFLHLPLTNDEGKSPFALAINQVIKNSAHQNGLSAHTQYGRAFRKVQKHLNTFNMATYDDPLTGKTRPGQFFHPIYAPGENTMASYLLLLPLAAKTAELLNNGKEKITGVQDEFVFTAETLALDQQLLAAKEAFRSQLTSVREYVETARIEAQALINEDELALNYHAANNSITGFADLLAQRNRIVNAIDLRITTIDEHLSATSPALDVGANIKRLATDCELDHHALADCVVDKAQHSMLTQHAHLLTTLREQLVKEKSEISKYVAETMQNDSLNISDTFQYAHDDHIRQTKERLQKKNDEIEQTTKQIKIIKEAHDNASRLESSLTHASQLLTRIRQFTLTYCDKNLALPAVENQHDILAPATNFYALANQQAQQLSLEFQQQVLSLTTLQQHYLESNQVKDIDKLNGAIEALKTNISYALTAAKEAYEQSKKNTNALLLCHLFANAILNFHHWNAVSQLTETTHKVKAMDDVYRIPLRISLFVARIKNADFSDWETDPEQAKKLLAELHARAKNPSNNKRVESFLAVLRDPANIEPPVAPEALRDVAAIIHPVAPIPLPMLIRPDEHLARVRRVYSPLDKNPVLKRTLIGLLIGVALVAAMALVAGVCFATLGLGAVGLGVAGGIAVGVIGASTITGYISGKYQKRNQPIAHLAPHVALPPLHAEGGPPIPNPFGGSTSRTFTIVGKPTLAATARVTSPSEDEHYLPAPTFVAQKSNIPQANLTKRFN